MLWIALSGNQYPLNGQQILFAQYNFNEQWERNTSYWKQGRGNLMNTYLCVCTLTYTHMETHTNTHPINKRQSWASLGPLWTTLLGDAEVLCDPMLNMASSITLACGNETEPTLHGSQPGGKLCKARSGSRQGHGVWAAHVGHWEGPR